MEQVTEQLMSKEQFLETLWRQEKELKQEAQALLVSRIKEQLEKQQKTLYQFAKYSKERRENIYRIFNLKKKVGLGKLKEIEDEFVIFCQQELLEKGERE